MNLLTLRDVALRLGVTKETVRRWAVSGRIPAFKIHEKGHWNFRASDIDTLLSGGQPSSSPEHGRGA